MSAVQSQTAFLVAAFTARTTNEAESRPETASIPGIWQQLGEAFPDHTGETYGVYTEYQSDQNGEYTFGAGKRIERGAECPHGMTILAVPEARYLVYPARGQQPHTAIAAWQSVWADFDPVHDGLERTYQTDYELHQGPETVELYISVRTVP